MSFLDSPTKHKGGRPHKLSESQREKTKELRSQGYTIQWIIEELNLNISVSALSRDIKRP